jgi:NTP pyrophosphatase (non-canonical NTP hydrolase)
MHYFDEYEQLVNDTAIYPNRGSNIVYPALGLCGEAGEVAEKIKKVLRDQDGVLNDETREAIVKEMGDVIWYLVALSKEIGTNINHVIDVNRKKLIGRRERGTLQGSGDDR